MLTQALAPVQAAHPDVDIRVTVVEGHPAPVLVEASGVPTCSWWAVVATGSSSACSSGR